MDICQSFDWQIGEPAAPAKCGAVQGSAGSSGSLAAAEQPPQHCSAALSNCQQRNLWHDGPVPGA